MKRRTHPAPGPTAPCPRCPRLGRRGAATAGAARFRTRITIPKRPQVLFSAGDVLAGWQLHRLARLQGASQNAALAAAALWLVNPFTFAISTRGSCDSLVVSLLLGTLLLLMRGAWAQAAVLYGLAVHVRIYPIIYAPAIVLFLAARHEGLRRRAEGGGGGGKGDGTGAGEVRALAAELGPACQWCILVHCGAALPSPAKPLPRNSWHFACAALLRPRPTSNNAPRSRRHAPQAAAPPLRQLVIPALRQAALFGGVSGGVFVFLGLLFYRIYGDLFLQEAFLHHLSRRDPRHCFSVHWYGTYLRFMDPWPSGAAAAAAQGLVSGGLATAAPAGGGGALVAAAAALDPERLAPLPQAAALLALALALYPHLPFCWLVSTIVFVAFNKVSTAQYFVWWLCLLPASLPGLAWPPPRGLALAAAGWAAAQLHWLGWGYLLEFEGRPAHLALWAASVVFLVANAALVVALLRAWRPARSFLALSADLAGSGGGSGGARRRGG